VLDRPYVQSLGTWDVVYSWGVLHHTGDMYGAFANTLLTVHDEGRLVIAIYNDQGWKSKAWLGIKRAYNTNGLARAVVLGVFIPYSIAGAFVSDLVRLRSPTARYSSHVRGMSHIYDWVDWLGGLPFESRIEVGDRVVLHREGILACKTDQLWKQPRMQPIRLS